MAVTFDAVGPAGGGGSSANGVTAGVIMTWTHTCTGADGCLYVAVAITVGSGGSDAGLSTTVTYNSVAMTSLSKVHSGASTSGYVELFRLRAPSTGANTVSVTMAGTAASVIDCEGGSVSFTGVDQTTSEGTPATNTANGTSVSVNVTGTTAGNVVLDAMCTGTSITGPGGSQTQRWLKSNGTIGSANQAAQSTQPASGTITMSWTGGSDFWGIIAVEVKAVAGAGAAEANFPFMADRFDQVLPGEIRPFEVQGPDLYWVESGAVVSTADVSVVGLLVSGAALYADSTHDTSVAGLLASGGELHGSSTHDVSLAGLLASGAVLYGPTTHDATLVGHLASGSAIYSASGTLAYIVTGLLTGGAVLYAPVGHDVPVAGYLASGSELHGAISHGATVAGLLASGAVLYGPVTHNATVAGYLASGAVLYGLLSAGADISVVGLLTGGAALYAPVSHAATVSGLLVAGGDLHGPVSHTASVAGLLASGADLHSPVTHTTSVVGLLASGAVLLGDATHRVSLVGYLASGAVLYGPYGLFAITLPPVTDTLRAVKGYATIVTVQPTATFRVRATATIATADATATLWVRPTASGSIE